VNESGTHTVLLKHNIFRDFVYPGGHADGNYDLLSVALREVEEETGLVVEPMNDGAIFSIQCIPVKGHIKNGEYVSPHIHHDVAFLFVAKDGDMDKIRVLECENSAVEWVPIDDTWLDGMADWFQYVYVKFKKKFGGA
jgi:8-oxo-dGTP pyrophosphatase MutT (NUDIX family)